MLVIMLWTSILISAVTGIYYTPNYRVLRVNDSKAFWQAWGVSLFLGAVATYLLLRF